MNASNPRRPFVRSMTGWWRRNPYFVEYMAHEATALFVAAYAIVLLVGIVRLAQGEAAWNAWLEALKAPWSIGLHVVVLVAVAYHCWSWFRIMPKTLPPIVIGGKRLEPAAITAAGLAAAAIASLALLGIVWGMTR